jgi:hypothetical protein
MNETNQFSLSSAQFTCELIYFIYFLFLCKTPAQSLTHAHTLAYVHAYTCVNVCVCVYVCMYVCMYT